MCIIKEHAGIPAVALPSPYGNYGQRTCTFAVRSSVEWVFEPSALSLASATVQSHVHVTACEIPWFVPFSISTAAAMRCHTGTPVVGPPDRLPLSSLQLRAVGSRHFFLPRATLPPPPATCSLGGTSALRSSASTPASGSPPAEAGFLPVAQSHTASSAGLPYTLRSFCAVRGAEVDR